MTTDKAASPPEQPEPPRKQRSALGRLFRWSLAIVAVLVIVAAGIVGYGYWQFTKQGPLTRSVTVLIPKNTSLAGISDRLEKRGVIDGAFIFRIWVRLHGAHNRLRAGEFRFPRGVSQKQAMKIIVSGKQVLRRFTIPEGLTSQQVVERLKSVRFLTGEVARVPPEGSLLPDTYFYVRGETRDSVIRRMGRALTESLDAAWAKRMDRLPFKTKREALILASIIEKETSKKGERRRVAAVFVNRLRIGMLLQTDPTVIYAITKGKGPLGRRLLRRDLKVDDPYNTYRYKGLPPGPIANPGRAAILAAVTPLKTDELYFVADGTGGHAFAKTKKEHDRNVRRWRKIRREVEKKNKAD
jgi:UPF0755 protein